MQSLTTVTSQLTLAQQLEQAVQKEVKERVDKLREELVKKYTDEFERKVRELIGRVSLSLASHYSIEHVGGEVLIRVKID